MSGVNNVPPGFFATMTDFQNTKPDTGRIGEIQDGEAALRLKRASGTFHRRSKWFHFGGWVVAIAFALLSPVVLLLDFDWGPLLGALAALWIAASRLAFEPARLKAQRLGARAQEQFDCLVLGLEWNWSLTKPISPEEIHRAGQPREGEKDFARGWYSTDAPARWPISVLMCQRANGVWGRRQHEAFGTLIAWIAGVWIIFGIALAWADGASLETYLVTLLLPSLPAILDALDLMKAQRGSSLARGQVEEQADWLLSNDATHADMRELQDQLFSLRSSEPLVPEWFYKLKRDENESAMAHAAKEIAAGRHGGSGGQIDR